MEEKKSKWTSFLAEKRRIESVKIILLLGNFCSWAFAFTTIYLQISDHRYTNLTLISTIAAIFLTIANFLAYQSKLNSAIWLFIFTTEIIFTVISLTIANLGIILAIILLIIVGNIALQSLSSTSSTIALLTGIITSITLLLVDIFSLNPLHIIHPDHQTEIIAVITSGLIILILGMALLKNNLFNSIKTQMIVTFIIISIIPLCTIAIPQLILINSASQKNAYETVSNKAKVIAKDFDNTLLHLINNNTNDAELPIFNSFIENSNGIISSDDILKYFQIIRKRNPNIISYSLLDKNGKILIDTRYKENNFDKNIIIDHQIIIKKQKSLISDISFDLTINKHIFYISSPIVNKNKINGILCVGINADFLQAELIKQSTIQDKDDLIAILINQNGIILGNNSSDRTIFKLISPIKPDQLIILQKRSVLSPGSSESLVLNLSDLQNKLRENNQDSVFQTKLSSKNEKTSLAAYNSIKSTEYWKIIVGLQTTSFVDATNTQTRLTIFIAAILMLAAFATAIATSNSLTSPINYIINALKHNEKHHKADFSVLFERNDEIGQVSKALNVITSELKEIAETIDDKVHKQIENINSLLEDNKQQSDQLHSIVNITHKITSTQNLNELFAQITQQISLNFDFYHVGIFLTDEARQYATLRASNSEAGKKMVEKGYRIKIDQTDGIGFVMSTGKHYIAVDSNEKATIFNYKDLPKTHSEIILPLYINENIIGVIDLQSDKIMLFDIAKINNLKLLANQVSVTLQNVRLFEETRSALAEAQIVYRQSATASWRSVLYKGTKGYRYINGSIEAIKESPKQITNQNIEKKNTNNNKEALIIPITIREKNLGTLSIRQTSGNHIWSNSEIRVYQSIVDRISFALENARLYQDAQRRASKERVISEISTKVSSSVNMDNILQTAVEELGRVLQGSEIIIQLEHENEPDMDTVEE